MNNDNKILQMLTDLKQGQDAQGKDITTMKNDIAALKQEQHSLKQGQDFQSKKIDEQGKDILILKGSIIQTLTISEAVKAGVEDVQKNVKVVKNEVETLKQGQKTLERNLQNHDAKGDKKSKQIEDRVEELEKHTGVPNIHKN